MIPRYTRGKSRSPKSFEINDAYNRLKKLSANAAAAVSVAAPSDIFPVKYDMSAIANVGKDMANALQDAQDLVKDTAKDAARDLASAQNESDAKSLNEDSGSAGFLTMIFKIVPIGLNIVRRVPNVVKGFKDIVQGFVEVVAGLIVSSITIFIDGFRFSMDFFSYAFTWLLCAVFKITTIHKCIIFYVLDIILMCLYLIIFSICFMLDAIFFLQSWLGIGLVDVLGMVGDGLDQVDELVFGASGVHIFSYPDWIHTMCYTCAMMGDTTDVQKSTAKFKYDLFSYLPKKVFRPMGRMGSGIGNVLSIFAI